MRSGASKRYSAESVNAVPASVASKATITTDHSGRPSSSLCAASQAISNNKGRWMPTNVTANSLALKERGNRRDSPAYKRIHVSGKKNV